MTARPLSGKQEVPPYTAKGVRGNFYMHLSDVHRMRRLYQELPFFLVLNR